MLKCDKETCKYNIDGVCKYKVLYNRQIEIDSLGVCKMYMYELEK